AGLLVGDILLNRAGDHNPLRLADPAKPGGSPEAMGFRSSDDARGASTPWASSCSSSPAPQAGHASIPDFLANQLRHPYSEWIGARIKWLAELGTAGYPPDVRRRLLILNLFAYLVAATTAGYAIQHIQLDFDTYKPLVFINLALLVMALTVPAMHRINEIAGGMLIVVSEYIALMAFTAYLGHSAGIHLQYIIAGAAAFVVFGLERLKLVTTVVVLGL